MGFANATTSGTLILNAVNKSGLTSLDLLLMFPSEAGDREINDLLRNAGAKKANDIHLSPTSSFGYNTNQQTMENSCEADDLVEYFKFKKGRDSPSDAQNAFLVMTVLIATTMFQAGINPPSGIWQDSVLKGNDTTPEHRAGSSILASYSAVSYLFFVIFNSIGLLVSLYMITILTYNLPMQLEFQVCVSALYVTYYIALTNMAPPDGTRVFVIVVSSLLPPTIHYVVKLIRLTFKKGERVLLDLLNWLS